MKSIMVLALFVVLFAAVAHAGFMPTEICDGIDNDGDGEIDEGGVCGEIPEFTTIGAGLILVGAGLYARYKKRR